MGEVISFDATLRRMSRDEQRRERLIRSLELLHRPWRSILGPRSLLSDYTEPSRAREDDDGGEPA